MSIESAKFPLTVNSYADRAQQANSIKNECARAEEGKEVDLNEIVDKLDILVRAMNQDLIAIGKPKANEKLHKAFLAHRKDLKGLTARVNALSSKAGSFPTWAKLVGFTALAVGGLALTAFAASRDASAGAPYSGIPNVGGSRWEPLYAARATEIPPIKATLLNSSPSIPGDSRVELIKLSHERFHLGSGKSDDIRQHATSLLNFVGSIVWYVSWLAIPIMYMHLPRNRL